jgi:hypothetical protein
MTYHAPGMYIFVRDKLFRVDVIQIPLEAVTVQALA